MPNQESKFKDPGYRKTYRRNYYRVNKKKMLETSKKWRQDHKERFALLVKKRTQVLRLKIIDHYTNGQRKCMCPGCDVDIHEFLTIDHINGGGTKHRRIIGGGIANYYWIIKHNFPEDLQILCMNCNFTKGKYGICPHIQCLKIRSIRKK